MLILIVKPDSTMVSMYTRENFFKRMNQHLNKCREELTSKKDITINARKLNAITILLNCGIWDNSVLDDLLETVVAEKLLSWEP